MARSWKCPTPTPFSPTRRRTVPRISWARSSPTDVTFEPTGPIHPIAEEKHMKRTRKSLIALAAASVLVLTACNGDNGDTETEGAEPGDFPEGSTMAELQERGSITIGTKFD